MSDYLYLPGVAGERASAADGSELTPSGIFDFRMRFAADSLAAGAQFLAAHYVWNTSGWWINLVSATSIDFRVFHSGGSTAYNADLSADLGISDDGSDVAIRITYDPTGSGASQGRAVFYTSADEGVTWDTKKTVDGGNSNPILDAASAMNIGGDTSGNALAGAIYWTQILDGSSTVFDADFTNLTPAEIEAASFTEDSANAATVDINGDEWAYGNTVTSIAGKVPELYLDMEDGYAHVTPTWFDRAGNNHHGQWGSAPGANTNEPVRKYFAGDKFVWMPGTTSNVLISEVIVLDDDLDFQCRVRLDDWTPSVSSQLFHSYASGTDAQFGVQVTTSGTIQFAVRDSDGAWRSRVVSSATGITDGDIQWVRVTWDLDNDASGNDVKFYLGGSGVTPVWVQLGATDTEAGVKAWGATSTALPVISGSDNLGNSNGTPREFYEVLIYNGGALVLDVNLADAVSPYATFTERSSNAATVTINRSTSGYVSTVIDKTMALFSTDDYVEVPDDAGLQFAAGESLTIIGVGQLSGVSTSAMQLAGTMPFPLTGGYSVSVAGSGAIRFNIADINPTVALDDGVAPTVLVWQTYAGVRNVSGDDIEVFVDGVGTGSPTTDNTTATLDGGNVFRIGALADVTPSNHWEGSISKVVLFREALTDAEVLAVSNALILDKSGAQTLHDDALMRWILDNDDYGSSIELVGRLNERNATSGIEMEEARTDYLAG